MPYKDKDKQREYQRKWYSSRRAKYLKGAICAVCSSDEDIEVDHVDRSTKVDHRIWSWSEDRIVEELKKCQFLCSIHHYEKTSKENSKGHGRWNRYKNGCRCDECREAHRIGMKEYRSRQVPVL